MAHRRPPHPGHAGASRVLVVDAVPRRLHPPGHGGRARLPEPDPAARRARDLPRLRRRRDGRAGLEGLRHRRPRHGASSRSSPATSCSASRTSCRSTRAASRRCRPSSRSTRRSASRPTRTGRTTRARPARRYLTQAGDARRPQLHLGRDRPRHRDRAVPRPHPTQLDDHRQLLGRPDPRRSSTSCCRSRSSAPSCSSGRASPRRGTRPTSSRPSRARQQTIAHRARSPPRSGSRSWATTAAASSTPTRPIRSRTRPPLTNWLEIFAHPAVPVRA